MKAWAKVSPVASSWGDRVAAGEQMLAVYRLALELGDARRLTPIQRLVEMELDTTIGRLVVGVNGTREPATWRGLRLPAYHVGLFLEDWPLGIVGMFDGSYLGVYAGAATEEALVAGLTAAIAQARGLA